MTHHCEAVVLALRAAKHKPEAIRTIMGRQGTRISLSTIHRMLRAHEEGLDVPRTATTRATSAAVTERRSLIQRLALNIGSHGPKFCSSTAIKVELAVARRGRKTYNVSAQTVRRDLKCMNFKSYKRSVRPSEPTMRRKRFAKRELEKGDRLRLIIFSDEHFISINDHGVRRQYAQRRNKVTPIVRKARYNVPHAQIWAAIGIDWRSDLVFFPRREGKKAWRLNGERYISMCLGPNLVKFRGDVVFMDDGARSHRNRLVNSWMCTNGVDRIDDWPPYSPDLNPIEQLWALLDDLIAKQRPKTMDELIAAANKAWRSIPQRTINNFVLSYCSKLQKVAAE